MTIICFNVGTFKYSNKPMMWNVYAIKLNVNITIYKCIFNLEA